MTRTHAAILGALAAAAMLALPFASSAAQPQIAQNYTTLLTQTGPAAEVNAFTGYLRLTVSSDGIVQGWYMQDYYQSRFIPVTGSSKDGKLWLSIGDSGQLQINADVQRGGKLVGSAVETSRLLGSMQAPATFDFVASPKTT